MTHSNDLPRSGNAMVDAEERDRTPNGDSICRGCGSLRYADGELSDNGLCNVCSASASTSYYCHTCEAEFEAVGVLTVCPNCGEGELTTDDNFIDGLIAQKQSLELENQKITLSEKNAAVLRSTFSKIL